MKTKTILYWISTSLVAAVMTISGLLALVHAPSMMESLAHLGYPAYFGDLLAVAKLAGVGVLLLPGFHRFKEWAYVGFGITIISAVYSHLLSGDGVASAEPLFFFAMLVVSYLTRPGGAAGLSTADLRR